jgi:hypothetical protein
MLSSEARAALRRQWFNDLEAETARRAAAPEVADDAAREAVLNELYAMAERILAVQRPGDAEAIEQLLQANADWAVINAIRNARDLAPAEAISMVLTRDPNIAMKMLNRWARAHGYT